MKALLLDIGNSRLKWGLFKDSAIYRTGHLAIDSVRARDLSALARSLPRGVDTVLACNVAGDRVARMISGFVCSHGGQTVRFLRAEAQAFGVTNAYRQPHRLGADRWVAMIGARAFCKAACVVVDAGTAITIDVLDASGRHLGGQILPGIMLMTESLARNTSDLPTPRKRISAQDAAAECFATSTTAAIKQGAIAAASGAVERALRLLRQRGEQPMLILTGGDASLLQLSLDEAAELRPHLVLEGLCHYLNPNPEQLT